MAFRCSSLLTSEAADDNVRLAAQPVDGEGVCHKAIQRLDHPRKVRNGLPSLGLHSYSKGMSVLWEIILHPTAEAAMLGSHCMSLKGKGSEGRVPNAGR